MLGEIVNQTRAERPLVHCLTNYVTANDCANILLACGASPIMADDPEEAAEIVAQCNGLVLNLGTPNPRKLSAMMLAGREANRLGLPVILDPVGVGSSLLRMDAARSMLEAIRFAAIRGNASEISALVHGMSSSRGVDAGDSLLSDSVTEYAAELSLKTGAVVVVTGDSDIVTDGAKTYRVMNGHPMMRTVTGAGCQLSALLGAYISANPGQVAKAALAAVCAMGLCGEIAFTRLGPLDGNAAYRNYIIDAIYHLSPKALEKGARYEVIR